MDKDLHVYVFVDIAGSDANLSNSQLKPLNRRIL